MNIYDVDPATLQAVKDRVARNFKVFIELNLVKPENKSIQLLGMASPP